MRETSLKEIIFNNSSTVARGVATGLIAFMLANSLSACDELKLPSVSTDTTTTVTQTTTEAGSQSVETLKPDVNVEHSQTFLNARAKWAKDWDARAITLIDYTDKQIFQMKGAPFTFLADKGVVYYDEDGNICAYGNEDYSNNDCIMSRLFIDENTPEYDVYVLTQYISGPVDDLSSNNGREFVATWLLKYTLDKNVYKDLLLYNGDFREGFLFQQIDSEFEPEVISESLIRYDLINYLGVFKDYEIINEHTEVKYISNIDYDNLSLTVNYSTEADKGKIYSYDVKLKETLAWEKVLEETRFDYGMPVEVRDSLTVDDLMPQYPTLLGFVLSDFNVGGITGSPTSNQMADAELLHNFTCMGINGLAPSTDVNKYERGEIKYEQVNEHTERFSKSEQLNQ